MKQFILSEDTKTLFLLNYAFVSKENRERDLTWIRAVTLYKGDKLIGSKELAKNVRGLRRDAGLFDLQDIII